MLRSDLESRAVTQEHGHLAARILQAKAVSSRTPALAEIFRPNWSQGRNSGLDLGRGLDDSVSVDVSEPNV